MNNVFDLVAAFALGLGIIEIFEGRIGGGKSYSAMERMFAHWLRGGLVATNLPVNWPETKAYVVDRYGVELQDGQFLHLSSTQIKDFYRHTPSGTFELPVLVVIDEAHIWLASRMAKRDDDVAKLMEFLTMSRHMHTDIICISQAAANMDVKIARLAQYIWRFRDMQKWRVQSLGLGFPFPVTLQICYDGADGKTKMYQRWAKRDVGIFKTYDSHALHNPVDRLDGTLTKFNVRVVRKRFDVPEWAWWLLGVSFVVLLFV